MSSQRHDISRGRPFILGVWMQMPPHARLRGEGITQVLLRILRLAASPEGPAVVIACAVWTRPEIEQLLAEYGLAAARIEIFTGTSRWPRLLALYNRLVGASADGSKPSRRSVLRLLTAPLSLVGLLLTFAWRGLRKALSLTRRLAKALVTKSSFRPALWTWNRVRLFRRFLTAGWTAVRRPFVRLRDRTRAWFKTTLPARILRRLNAAQFSALARRASGLRDVAVWLIPNPGFRHAAALQAPRVVVVPDMVHRDFPDLYAHAGISDETIRSVVAGAAATISYLPYVRDRHVVEYLGVPPANAHVIPHAPMLVDSFLPAGPDRRRAALAAIHAFLRQYDRRPTWTPFLPEGYLYDFPFDEVRYLFVSSQIRPHKNYLNLFLAYETLLRRKYRNVKLVITGRLHEGQRDLCGFLRSRRLELDVLSLYDLPPDVHAAFYLLAELSVVPTLSEGGFPFPFSESLSVGTPVVMSDIPATRDVIGPPLAGLMLFDPADPAAIADRIDWALAHRYELLQAQRPLFEQLQRRTWDQVADEYMAVLARAARPAPAKEPHP